MQEFHDTHLAFRTRLSGLTHTQINILPTKLHPTLFLTQGCSRFPLKLKAHTSANTNGEDFDLMCASVRSHIKRQYRYGNVLRWI